jgi:hypothetical protein
MPVKTNSKSEAYYRQAVKVLRHGFIDEATERSINVGRGLSNAEAVRRARAKGFPVGGEYTYRPGTGELKAFKRMGKFANGFEADEGFDLREIDKWSPSQKSKVTKLYKLVDHLTARPYHIYRGRKPKNLRLVQEAAQHEQFPKNLVVAFLPVSNTKVTPKIKISKKGIVTVIEGKVRKRSINFKDHGITPKDLEDDAEGIMKELDRRIKGKRYVIQAGKYEIVNEVLHPSALPSRIRRYIEKYNATDYDATNPNSSFYGNWLLGVNAYDFDTRPDFKAYRAEKRREKAALKRKRKIAKERFRKKYGKRHVKRISRGK